MVQAIASDEWHVPGQWAIVIDIDAHPRSYCKQMAPAPLKIGLAALEEQDLQEQRRTIEAAWEQLTDRSVQALYNWWSTTWEMHLVHNPQHVPEKTPNCPNGAWTADSQA